MEAYEQSNGVTTTPAFAKYILPTALDVPHVTSVLIDEPDPNTPLGVKGIGEPCLTPTAPAICNAIYDAIGVRMTRLPATPERVLEALRSKREAVSRPRKVA
jgi:CO/xanthine dehydrogenase Mo-binding subunit